MFKMVTITDRNYNREPCRPVYTQQKPTSSLKAFKRLHSITTTTTKTKYDLELEEEHLLIMHILPDNLPDYLTFRHGFRTIAEV